MYGPLSYMQDIMENECFTLCNLIIFSYCLLEHIMFTFA